jgi:hypothetical protein
MEQCAQRDHSLKELALKYEHLRTGSLRLFM